MNFICKRIFYSFLTIFFIETVTGDSIVELIKAAGYAVEVHHVQTSDGFRLRMHRIPIGVRKLNYEVETSNSAENGHIMYKNESRSSKPEPIFLMHGLFCAAAMWVAENSDKSLGFMLADAGFDVWMLSARATSLSASHKSLDPQSKKYWDYSFHEIGYYDLPAAINYVLQKTKQEKLRYVGHSQGCTVFAVALTMHPDLNKKIASAYLMTPAVFLHHMSSMLRNVVANEKEIQEVAAMLRIYGLQVKSPIYRRLSDMFCKDDQSTNIMCSDVLFRIIGGDSGQLDKGSFIPMMTKTVVDNVSLKQLAHFAQVVQNAKFARYDYGPIENYKHYKSNNPPEYNLTKIQVPITAIYGTKDALVSPTDVELFISKITNVRETLKLPWNHLDFAFGKDVDVNVNDFIIRSMKKEALIDGNLNIQSATCQDFTKNNESEKISTCQK